LSLISAAGDVDPALCAPFTRGAGSQLKPPQNFLQNLANITTSGEDFKGTWLSAPLSFGHLSAAMQATRVNDYKAVDTLGLVAQRQVGIEVLTPRSRAGASTRNWAGQPVASMQVSWTDAFHLSGFKIEAGVNNLFGTNPPVCYTCTLNGYDAGTCDLPGAFWNARATYKF